MNDKLRNYTEQPDPAVWQEVTNTLKRKKTQRQRMLWTGVSVCGIVVAGLLVSLLAPSPISGETTGDGQQLALNNNQYPAVVQNTSGGSPVSESVASAGSFPKTVSPDTGLGEVDAQRADGGVCSPNTPGSSPDVVPSAISDSQATAKETTGTSPASGSVASASSSPKNVSPDTTSTSPDSPATASDNPPVTSPSGQSYTQEAEPDLWFPNVFSPSSDQEDVRLFKARKNTGSNTISQYKMAIYNRSGGRVFYGTDINTGWDGTYQGRPMPQGAYVYVVFYTDQEGLQHHTKGTVTLVR